MKTRQPSISDPSQLQLQKLHRPVVHQVWQALDEIQGTETRPGGYADKVIERFMKRNKVWGAKDRRFFAESVYEIIRWKRLFETVLVKSKLPCSSPNLWAALRCKQNLEIPDWPETENARNIITPSFWTKTTQSPAFSRAILESIPDWIDKLASQDLGDAEWTECLRCLNLPAEVFLRVNELKTNIDDLISKLLSEDIEVEKVPGVPSALRLKIRKNVFTTQSFKAGLFEVQDAGSQQIAPLLEIVPGMRVIDACAGAGGKSLHIASLLKNKGRIVAMDIHDWKLNELKQRARRNGVDVIETKLIDSTKTIKRLEKSADRVLLDVPCSGLGVLKRNPDSKWKLNEGQLQNLLIQQSEILEHYSPMTKVGGTLVYATCSVLSCENQDQIKKFLEQKKGSTWTLIREINLRPNREGFDGFYAAALKRNS